MGVFDKFTGINVASEFKLQAKVPLDGRLVVETIADRDALITENGAYEGMVVYVKSEGKKYTLCGTTANDWKEDNSDMPIASTDKVGGIKLYNRSGVNASGLIVYEDGSAVINVDNNHGLYRSGAGQITTAEASETEIDAGTDAYKVITPRRIKYAVSKYAGTQAVEDLRKDVYGERAMSVTVKQDFELKFKCSAFSNVQIPTGTWTCDDISGIYNNIVVSSTESSELIQSSLSPTEISITDSYLENDYWELILIINLDPEDIDNIAINGLSSCESRKDFSGNNKYPYIVSVDEETLKVAVGRVQLPDTGVVVGSEITMTINRGQAFTGTSTNLNLSTKDKSSILAAINELAARNASLEDGSVTTAKIKDGAVTTEKIKTGAVTHNQLGENAVQNKNILDAAVTTEKLHDRAVTGVKIGKGAVAHENLAENSVWHEQLGNKAVTTENIADGAATNSKIADDSISEVKLRDGCVTEIKLHDGAVTTDKIAAKVITSDKLADGAVTYSKIANDAVINSRIANDAVTTGKIKDGAVNDHKLADGAVTMPKLAEDVQARFNYNTSPVKIGTWIDGKPIYRQVFTGVLEEVHIEDISNMGGNDSTGVAFCPLLSDESIALSVKTIYHIDASSPSTIDDIPTVHCDYNYCVISPVYTSAELAAKLTAGVSGYTTIVEYVGRETKISAREA